MNRIRVLMVIPGDKSQEVMPFAHRQIDAIEEHSIVVEIFYLSSRINPAIILDEYFRFKRTIKLFKPDIIHSHFGTMTSFFCAVSTRVPLIITFRGSDLNPTPRINRIRHVIGMFLSQLSCLFARGIICVSTELKSRLWWKRSIVRVIPSGVNLNIFKPMDLKEARKILNWDLDEDIVLFNSRNDPIGKGLDLALEAVNIAKCGHEKIRLIVTKGEIPPNKMPLYFNSANCLLMLSEYEGSPNVVKEALACNCPIISVNVGDVVERIEGVYPSMVVERSSKEIAAAISDVLKLGIRSNGSDYINSISDEKISERIVAYYRQILFDIPNN